MTIGQETTNTGRQAVNSETIPAYTVHVTANDTRRLIGKDRGSVGSSRRSISSSCFCRSTGSST